MPKEEVFVCSVCGEEFLVEDRKMYLDEEYCPDCYYHEVDCKGDDHKYYGVHPSDFM